MHHHKKLLLYVIVLWLLLDGHANAATLNAHADAQIQAGTSASTNLGSSPDLIVKGTEPVASSTRKAYVRFDVSSISGLVTDAELSFQIGLVPSASPNPVANHDVAVFGLLDSAPGQNWGELSITWNNAPSNNLASGTLFDNSVSLGAVTKPPTIAVGDEISLTGQPLIDFLNADTDGFVTFLLSDVIPIVSSARIASRENTVALGPRLTFTEVDIVPLPGVASLMGGGLVVLCGRRRAR